MRDLIEDTLLRDRKRSKKAQHPAEIKSMASRVLLPRLEFYVCATTAAQGREDFFRARARVKRSLVVVRVPAKTGE